MVVGKIIENKEEDQASMHAHSIPPKRAAQQYLYVMYHTFYVMMKKEASPCQYPSFFAPSLPGMKDFISRVHSEVHTELRANEYTERKGEEGEDPQGS